MADEDVYICHHDSNQGFVTFLIDHLEQKGLKVWKPHGDYTKGKALVNAKVCIVVLSEQSLKDKECEDAISLAYISDKPLFPVALRDFPDLEKGLTFSMKLILAKLNWMFFIPNKETSEFPTESMPVLLSSMKREIDFITEQRQLQEEEDIEKGLDEGINRFSKRRAFYKRWNSQDDVVESVDFWEENFGDAADVPWQKFKEVFLNIYRDQIKGQMPEEKIQWVINILYGDIFELRKTVTKKMYEDFCGDASWGPDKFFLRMMDYVKGTIAMRGVFNMKSTVRLDAVQNLGQFRTASVISALLTLLEDKDANVRAVAAIALGKTEVRSRHVVLRLIPKLTDDDRLVREATCLSLGHLKAKTAVPHLVKRWRGDLISDVRAAAEVALEQVGSEEAKHALNMTYLLSKEMASLEAQE